MTPAAAPGRPRRTAASTAWLLALAFAGCLALAGCAALGAALHTGSALRGAGYQNANVSISTGGDFPAGGLVTVTYSSGPAGNDQRDAQGAEKIVWDTFSQHFGVLTIVKVSGGCTGPVCVTHSTELASATYAQLAARFGPRPPAVGKASPPLPGWAVPAGASAGVAGLVALAVLVTVLVVRRRRRPPVPPFPQPWPPWPPGPQASWPSGYPYQGPAAPGQPGEPPAVLPRPGHREQRVVHGGQRRHPRVTGEPHFSSRAASGTVWRMCGDHEHPAKAASSVPRAADGPAVDPVTLPEADEVAVTVMVDNTFDALLAPAAGVTRAPMGTGRLAARQFADGEAIAGLRAEHGFSALVTVRCGNTSSTLLFDTGASPDALAANAERLGVDTGALQGVVLSHGHFDHAGGFDGLARLRGRPGLPLTVHPAIWTRRRLELPGGRELAMPTLSKGALEREGFEVIERRQPSLLAGAILITGEVDRVTEFERGMPPQHQAWDGRGWRHDPAVIDDQALVISVRGRGLVIITGCGHAGVVNIVRHAMRLTGVRRLLAVIGGFHLSGPAFEPVITPTVAALGELAPELIAPGHCTGWRAQHTLAAALPGAWVQSSVGTTYTLSAA